MHVREAAADDVEAISRVLVASITDLCHPDHGGDRGNISRWTANKSPEALTAWLADPSSHVFVTEEDGELVCVGAFKGLEVQLMYVSPSHRFRGVSKAMLRHLEDEMRKGGVAVAELTSTETALRFYRSAGWREIGPSIAMFGFAQAHPMRKKLG